MSRDQKHKSSPTINTNYKLRKQLACEEYLKHEKNGYSGLKPWQRLNLHQTHSSVRRNVNFIPFRIMKDHLDLVLSTNYQHNEETFPDPIDIYFQPITIYGENVGEKTATKTDDKKHDFGKIGTLRIEPKTFKQIKKFVLAHKMFPSHPLIIGGVKQRVHPSSVKLMNSSHHSPQTNAGYMRQDRDGMIFYY